MKRLGSQEWVDEALLALKQGGIESVRVEKLATSLNVTKGSFYWHFDNRQALLEAMLLYWEELGTEQIIEQVNTGSSDPRTRLANLLGLALRHNDHGEAALDTRFRAWASVDPNAARALARVDKRRLHYVRGLLVELDVPDPAQRSGMLYRMLIGEYTWRMAGNRPASPAFIKATLALLTLK